MRGVRTERARERRKKKKTKNDTKWEREGKRERGKKIERQRRRDRKVQEGTSERERKRDILKGRREREREKERKKQLGRGKQCERATHWWQKDGRTDRQTDRRTPLPLRSRTRASRSRVTELSGWVANALPLKSFPCLFVTPYERRKEKPLFLRTHLRCYLCGKHARRVSSFVLFIHAAA